MPAVLFVFTSVDKNLVGGQTVSLNESLEDLGFIQVPGLLSARGRTSVLRDLTSCRHRFCGLERTQPALGRKQRHGQSLLPARLSLELT